MYASDESGDVPVHIGKGYRSDNKRLQRGSRGFGRQGAQGLSGVRFLAENESVSGLTPDGQATNCVELL
jgi:hypothetical protein